MSLEKILNGYKNYRTKYLKDDKVMAKLIHSPQTPETMIISCCDSRTDPAIIFECNFSQLFIVRNIANIVPPYEKDTKHHGTSAALEFGVKFLQIKDIIILGHTNCAGINAALDDQFPENDFISSWMSALDMTKCKHNNVLNCAIETSLDQSYENCKTFPWIAEKLENKSLNLHKWMFDLDSGKILKFCTETQSYVEI